jgi:hypothetical protein
VDSIGLLRAAGITDLLARRIATRATTQLQDTSRRTELVTLESSRLRYDELGQSLEALSRRLRGTPQYDSTLAEAATAYRKAGDEAGELRAYDASGDIGTPERDHG